MKKIFLSNGQVTFVSNIDFLYLAGYNWWLNDERHVRGQVDGTKQLIHRVIAERMGLDLSNEIDHIDHNPLNNQRENLRSATHNQNQANSKSGSKSGYKGVYRQGTRWRSQIRVNSQTIHLGYFTEPEEAHQAYCEAAEYHFGEFANP